MRITDLRNDEKIYNSPLHFFLYFHGKAKYLHFTLLTEVKIKCCPRKEEYINKQWIMNNTI